MYIFMNFKNILQLFETPRHFSNLTTQRHKMMIKEEQNATHIMVKA
jgi:hypothetical protein